MKMLIAFICPPFAVLLCGKPISAFFNMFLCMLLWFPGVFHAMAMVQQHHERKQTTRIVRAIEHGPKQKKRRARRAKPAVVLYDDPVIGEGGTKFKRRT